MEHGAWSIEKRQLAASSGQQGEKKKKDGGKLKAFCQLSVVRCLL
jgi:hypothetical protein